MKNQSDKSRLVTLLLCLFLGGLGIHAFYAGNTKSGTIRLILALTLVLAIVSSVLALVDLIKIATGSYKDGNGKVIANW